MSSPSASTDNAYGWDAPGTHFQLVALVAKRAVFRIGRLFQRLRSPRRLLATSLAVLFFGFYVLNGIFVLSARQPADPGKTTTMAFRWHGHLRDVSHGSLCVVA